jgi:hypothetical protein
MKVIAPVRESLGGAQAEAVNEVSGPAPRKTRLTRLGLLNNGKPGAGRLIKEMGRRLAETNEGLEIRLVVKDDPDYSHVSSDEDLASLFECDAVITAMGNCGSCTSSSVLDSLKLEAHGVPTAVICTTVFEDLARSLAASQEAPWYQPIIVPHSSDLTDKTISMWADNGMGQVRSWLLEKESGA